MLKLRITESIQFSLSRLGFPVTLSRLFKSPLPLSTILSCDYMKNIPPDVKCKACPDTVTSLARPLKVRRRLPPV